jgi:hypothetical protein
MSDAFRECARIGATGEQYVMERVLGPRFSNVFRVGGGQLALDAERAIGDILFRRSAGQLLSMEVKTEQRWTGNFVWELWSNRKKGVVGWSETCQSDVIGYLFLDREVCVVFDFRELRKWANGPTRTFRPGTRRIDDFMLVLQAKYDQANDTWFHLVPFRTGDLPPSAVFKHGQRVAGQGSLFAPVWGPL